MKKILPLVGLLALSFVAVNCQNKKVPESSGSSAGLKSIYYDFDDAGVRQDQVGSLQSNASYVKQGTSVTIEGHCDERGSNEYNLALGQRRADASRDYIINLGVNSGSVNTVSYGEEKPTCFDHAEDCWWRNRRADFRKR